MSIYNLLVIGLLLYSIYSVIAYAVRRGDNRGAFQNLRTSKPIRQLSAEEVQCLQPFLHDPANPTKKLTLESEAVYPLSGAFVQHGLSYRGGSTTHDTLAEVDVVLPYDARTYLDAVFNSAEVVLTAKHAIVVTLNREFDLAGGRQRAEALQTDERRWKLGESGPGESTTDTTEQGGSEADGTPRARILSQREETPAETRARRHPGYGILASLALAGAGVLLLISGYADSLSWLLPAPVLLALGLWLAWRQPGMPLAQKVNRVQGPLVMVALSSPSNSQVTSNRLFLGDQFPLEIPRHWAEFAAVPASGEVSVELRVDDYSVVRFGRKLSIDTEEQRFPSVYWGRHLSLALTGLALALLAWFTSEGLEQDLAHVRSRITAHTHEVDSAAALLAAAPQPGDMLHIKVQARCQLLASQGSTPAAPDCQHLRVGGQAPVLPDLVLPPELIALANADMLQANSSPMLDLMLRMQSGNDPFNRVPSVKVISELTALVLGVSRECDAHPGARATCTALMERLGSDLIVGDGERGMGWVELHARAKDGRLKKDYDDSAITRSEVAIQLKSLLQQMAAPALADFYAKPLQAALNSQQGGAVLGLLPSRPDVAAPEDWPQAWQVYQRLASDEGLQAVDETGMLVAVSTTADGAPIYQIDTERTPENAFSALLRLLPLLLGGLMLLGHGLLFVQRLNQSRARAAQIHALNAGRLI